MDGWIRMKQDKIGIEGETDSAKQSDQWQCYWYDSFIDLKMCRVFTVAQKRAAERRAAELQAIMKQAYSGLERLWQANIYPSKFHCGPNVCLRQPMSLRITISRHTCLWHGKNCDTGSAFGIYRMIRMELVTKSVVYKLSFQHQPKAIKKTNAIIITHFNLRSTRSKKLFLNTAQHGGNSISLLHNTFAEDWSAWV